MNGGGTILIWMTRLVLVSAALGGVWIANGRHYAWRTAFTNTFEFDWGLWLIWLVVSVLSGLLLGLAIAIPFRAPYRWSNLLAFGLPPLLPLAHFVVLWTSIERERDLPEFFVRPYGFDEPGPQFVFMVLLGAALASGFFGREETARPGPPPPFAPP